jgi:hypothetical protein
VLDEPSVVDVPPADVAEALPQDVTIESLPEEETIENTANDNVEPVTPVEDTVIEPPHIVEEGTSPALSKLKLS